MALPGQLWPLKRRQRPFVRTSVEPLSSTPFGTFMPAPTAGRVAQEAVIRVAGDGLTSVRPYCRCSSSKRSLHRKGANCSGRTTNCKGVLLTAVPSMGYGLQNIRSKIATRDHVRDCVFGAGAPVWSLPDQNCYPRASLRRYSLRSLPEAFGVTVSADGDQELGRQRAARLDRQRLINCHGCRGRSVDYRPSLGPLAAPQPTAQSVRRCMFGTART